MTEGQKKQIQSVIELEGWRLIEEVLLSDIKDVIEGDDRTIALHFLAKIKAKEHIVEKINSVKRLSSGFVPKESFK